MPFYNPEEKGRPIKIKDEGLTLVNNVASFDFRGDMVEGSAIGDDITENIGDGLPTTFLKLDQTTPQTTVGTFTFPKVVGTTDITTPLLIGGSAVDSKITYKSTTGAGTTTAIAHQWLGGTNGGTTIATMLNNGNVGIGTNTPESKLHIYGDSPILTVQANTSSGVNANPSIFLKNTQANAGFKFYYDGASTGNTYFDNYFTSGSMVFRTAVGGTPVTAMTINSFGNIGINVSPQTNKLSIAGSVATTTVGTESIFSLIKGDIGPSYPQMASFNLGRYALPTAYSPNSRLDINLKNSTNSSLIADVTVMSLQSNGNVGIGTTNPYYQLEVVKTSAGADTIPLSLRNSDNGLNTSVSLGFSPLTSNTITGKISNVRDVSGQYSLRFYNYNTSSLNETMRITAAGNVGIGTTNPSQKLDVNGIIKATAVVSNGVGTHPTGIGPYVETYIYSGDTGRLFAFDGASYYDLAIGDWNSGNPNIMLKVGGNVGINRGNPTYKLDVAGNLRTDNGANFATVSGNVGIGITTPSAKLDINSDILRLRTAKTPATAGASGNAGDHCWDADFLYICVATNTWKRAAITTW